MSYKHLTIEEVIKIEKYFKYGAKVADIANCLKRSLQPIYNVVNFIKSGGTALSYYERYVENKKRCSAKPIELPEKEIAYVVDKLKLGWNPQVIKGRNPEAVSCCERTLYRNVERGVFNVKLLPWQGKRNPNGHVEKRGTQTFKRTIHERNVQHPQLKEEFGHLEGDTIVGAKHKSAVITLVECLSKVIITLKPNGRTAEAIEKALIEWFDTIPRHLFKTITFDCGKEFSNWKSISNHADIDIYFADPGRPSQRGLNENSNGLLRHDGLTKGMDFNTVDESFIKSVANKRNHIPRKALDFKTPFEVFMSHIDVQNFLA
jgi:IS30 family transposase